MFNSKLVRYLLVGGTSFVVEISSLYVLHHVAHLSPTISVAISFWIGFIVAFVLQKTVTFRNKDTKAKDLSAQLLLYSMLVLFNYVFSLSMVYAFSDIAPVIAIRTFTIIAITAWNFILYGKIFAPRLHHVKKAAMTTQSNASPITRFITSKQFAEIYVLLSLFILIVSTLYWALLGAKLQLSNADQLVNSFLFDSLGSCQRCTVTGNA